MTYSDSVRFLYSLGNEHKNIKLGLERMRAVCDALGNPERSLRFIHVAGTNGKGSVCAMIEAALRASGQRTGLYTSPHLVSPTERIQIDGVPVSERKFVHAFDLVHAAVGDLDSHPTYFETVTAMALVLFAEHSVDRVVWEVGLGGRLDATNVVTPELCVIMPVSYDHQDYLGNTLVAIAGEKAGILKPGVPAVIAAQKSEARTAIETRAGEVGAPLLFVDPHDPVVEPRLPGQHQIENARAAAVALSTLGVERRWIDEGIRTARWPGRLELVRRKPDLYLDGAHNIAGIEALASFVETYYRQRKVWLVFGVMRDKNVQAMGDILFPLTQELILTAPATERAMLPAEIPAPPHARIAATVKDALAMTNDAGRDDLILVAGSLFLVGEARSLLVS